jgi:hypothetical protein
MIARPELEIDARSWSGGAPTEPLADPGATA